MNTDLVSYSHAQIRIWVHISLKVKYCHEVFDIREFREACQEMMIEIFKVHKIEYDRIGFDSNHFHTILDLARWKIDDLIKVMKGISGYKLLKQFPEIKKKYFYGSGLWSGTKYVYSVGRDKASVERYIAKQKYFSVVKGQRSLFEFA